MSRVREGLRAQTLDPKPFSLIIRMHTGSRGPPSLNARPYTLIFVHVQVVESLEKSGAEAAGIVHPARLKKPRAQVCEGLKKLVMRLRGISRKVREGTSQCKSEGEAWLQGIEQALARAGELYARLNGGASRFGEGLRLEWEEDGRPAEIPEGVGVLVVLKEARRREEGLVQKLERGYGAGSGAGGVDDVDGGNEIQGEIRRLDLKILGIERRLENLIKRRERAASGFDVLGELGDLRDEGGRANFSLFGDLVTLICRKDSSPAGALGQRARADAEARGMMREFEAWSKIQEEIEVLRTEERACEGARDALEERRGGVEELEGADIGDLVEGVKDAKAATSETLRGMERRRVALMGIRAREGRARAALEAKRCDLEAIRGEISELDAERAEIISLFAGWELEVAAGRKEGADWRDAQRQAFRAMEDAPRI